jgi:RNA polymerase sigma factor (sigma-70 family)
LWLAVRGGLSRKRSLKPMPSPLRRRGSTGEDRRRKKYPEYVSMTRMPRPPAANANDGPYINPRDTTPLTIEESKEYAALAMAGNVCARDRMVASCEGMLIMWVRKYARGLPHLFDDLLSECRLAVTQSIPLYDATRGMKFSSYAMFYVRNVSFELARTQRWTINLPIARNPEKAKKYGGRLRTRSTTLISADGEEYEMVIPSWDPSPDFLEHKVVREAYRTVLTDRERDIIESRMYREQTFVEIGARYDLSRTRIQQLEAKAYEKLRVHLERLLGFKKGSR